MRTFDADQPISLEGTDHLVLERSGNRIRLRNQSTGDIRDMSLAELSRLAPADAKSRPTAWRIDDLRGDAKQKLSLWDAHIAQILTGRRGTDDEIRPEYDPSQTTLKARIQTKIAELQRVGVSVSRPTIYRKIKAYREGRVGLVDGRSLREYGPLDNVDEFVLDALAEVMEAQANRSTQTKKLLIEKALQRVADEGITDRLPSPRSMYRYFDHLDKGSHVAGSAKTRRSLDGRPNQTFKKIRQSVAGAEVQIDSTPLNVLVRTEDGPTRPILTVMIDIATRAILASTIRFEATKGVDQVALLLQALTPLESRPDRTAHRDSVAADNPHAGLRTMKEVADAHNARPFVYPRRIMMDNGKDYLSQVFIDTAQAFGIDVTMSAPHTPTGKPIVERMFHSIDTMFTQHLPGYVSGSIENRGRKPEDDNLLSVDALYELFDDWVVCVWQNTPHSSLRDPHEPSVNYSPNQMLAALSEITATIHVPLTTTDYINLLPHVFRKISSTGLRIANRDYDSEELHALRNTASSRSDQRGKWEVKCDPHNSTVVWVKTRNGTFIECPMRGLEEQYEPFYELTRQQLREQRRGDVARTNTAITGTPLHRPPLQPSPVLPSDFPDEDISPIDSFDPDED